MSEQVAIKPSEGVEKEKVPPFVTFTKTPGGCSVAHNMIDPWFAIALLEMGKDALMTDMKKRTIIKPTNGGLSGFAKRMGMR